jgi:cell pole-organizing protein PopZ
MCVSPIITGRPASVIIAFSRAAAACWPSRSAEDAFRWRTLARAPEPDPTILSDRAAEASRGALDQLSRLVVKPETPGSDSLEGLVREMLRPMMAQWLDAHLPGIVERLVTAEIARIAGKRR